MRYGIIILLLFSELLLAAEEATRKIDPLSNTNLTKWTLGLFVILILIGVVAWAVKRFSNLGFSQTGNMKIISGLSIGNREKVVLMKAGESHILLGVTATQIQTLHVFEKGEIDEESPSRKLSFEESLKRVITKGAPTNAD